jgi:NAD(P)-dependent dehydrogenase (short-subunit alcohol dehydrogenase family)
MARIFITGSADGLGLLAAKRLVEQGHQVVLHARNQQRGQETMQKVPGAATVVTGDLARIDETLELADQVNALGSFDAVIHNAGVYRMATENIFSVNTLAPYILTCQIHKPRRLIFLSSGLHMQGHYKLNEAEMDVSRVPYEDSKLYVTMLSMAIARKWPDVYSNAVNPGWVPTKMGGMGAPDDLDKGYETQVWLAASDDENAKVSGRYFFHQQESRYHADAENASLQEALLDICGEISGIPFPVS